MCTLTIIPVAPHGAPVGYRLVTNRDELRTRAPAEPPRARRIGDAMTVWPVDADAGGTWVGANEHALTLCLLNAHPKNAPAPRNGQPARSRGGVIPSILDARNASEAIERCAAMPLDGLAPFVLVAVDKDRIVRARWDRERLGVEISALEPTCVVSSGLGDALVRPRIELFDAFLRERGPTPAMQDAFHNHAWPDRPEISVRMRRDDARTMSTTIVECGAGGERASVRMIHVDDAGAHALSLHEAVRAGTPATMLGAS